MHLLITLYEVDQKVSGKVLPFLNSTCDTNEISSKYSTFQFDYNDKSRK